MFEEARCVWEFKIAMFLKSFFYKLVSQDAVLRNPIHSPLNSHINIGIFNFQGKVIEINKFLWDQIYWHSRVFKSIYVGHNLEKI